MAAISLTVTYFLGRYKMAVNLEETASASAKAFRNQILDGDTKTIEEQIRDVLKLRGDEDIHILGKDFSRIYAPTESSFVPPTCRLIGRSCFEWYASRAEILLPIYYDNEGGNIYGYLFLARKMQTDWAFSFIVFSIFTLGYLTLLFGVTRITNSATGILAKNLETWSQVIAENPKNTDALSESPFSELVAMKTAIEGLNYKIEEFESKAAEEAKLLILRGIAHDLLGPLFQTQLYLATLKKQTESDPNYSLLIAKAMDSVKDVSDVASQVKMLNESPDPKDHINLALEVRLEVEALKNSEVIRAKEIDLVLDDSVQRTIDASLSRPELKRILQNLIHNSVDASEARSRIEVGVFRDGDQAVVSVRDYGHGIPEHLQKKVFQPDFTLKPGTGTGLGLAILKYIASARRGAIELVSTSAGTLIEVKIPIFSGKGAMSCPIES